MKFLIAGGGTGGHVYPALAIAKALQAADPSAQTEFVGTSRGIETKLVPDQGYALHLLPVGRLNKNVGILERVRTLVFLPISLLQACRLIWRLKPDLVLGVGGYASAPALVAAKLFRVPTCIWEPNAFPGMANRWLAKIVDHVILVFKEAAEHMGRSDFELIGMPVRPEIENASPRVPTTSDFCVLIFGGSQGARAINTVVSDSICSGHRSLKGVRFVHQTGKWDFESTKAKYSKCPAAQGKVDCLEYLDDMPDRYNWADLVVARSGTGTIFELAAMGKASILIPLPTAADDHQTKNAKVLADADAAILIPQKDFTVEAFIKSIEKLEKNPEQLHRMEQKARLFFQKNSAQEIAVRLQRWAGR